LSGRASITNLAHNRGANSATSDAPQTTSMAAEQAM